LPRRLLDIFRRQAHPFVIDAIVPFLAIEVGPLVMNHPVPGLPRVWPSVVHLLADAAAVDPEHEAVMLGEQRLSYGDLAGCVSAFAQELLARKIGAGSRVALLMHNSIDMVVALFGVMAAGAQLAPLNPAYTSNELGPILDDADCLAVVYDTSVASRLSELLDRFDPDLRFAIGPGDRVLTHRAAGSADAPMPLPSPDSLAMLLYTGGTTGRSKGVDLLHSAIAVNVSQRDALLPAREGIERVLVVTPLYHSYAMSTCFTTVLSRGTLVLIDRYQADAVLRLIDSARVTILAGSPTIFVGLPACDAMASASLDSLVCAYSGSAALSMETLRQWEQKTGAIVVEGYGQTEAGPVLTYNPLAGPRKTGSVGIAVPLTEVQIVDLETGEQVLGPGELGEIRARGPQIMQGYRGLPDETAAALRDGWLYTGDIGEVDTQGYYFIRDRKKDMVIVSGFNVYPREVEEALYSHPMVREAAVVGIADDYRGESLVALVVPSADGLFEAQLREYLAHRLVKYKIPARIDLVACLPKTAVGKTDKVAIRRNLLMSVDASPTSTSRPGE
jgi:long-chain acyl-CoA synthetase